MTKDDLVLLKLINQSQFGTTESETFLDVNWSTLFDEASLQSVVGLIAPEIMDKCTDKRLLEAVFRQKAAYIRYIHSEDELKQVLVGGSIPFVIMKGNAAAINYKDPSRRTMGDIDFLVLEDDFDRTRELLCNSGFILEHDFDDANYRHISFSKDKMTFELHKQFSHKDIDLESYIVSGLNNREIRNIEGHDFPMLPKLANGLVLLDHMRNHLKIGLGLRQVIDWMMYVYRDLDDEFWNSEFKTIAHEKGLDTLAVTATRMCQIYLGLPETITWCRMADGNVCEQLMECLLVSGNFGRKNGSGNSVEKVSTSIKSEGLFHWLQYAGEHNWEAYHKHHWLKPFCWFYQIFRYARQGFKSGRNKKQLKGDFDRSKERYELLKKLNIS